MTGHVPSHEKNKILVSRECFLPNKARENDFGWNLKTHAERDGTKLDFLISSHSTQRKAILYLYEENDIFIYLLYLWIKKMIKQYSMDPSSPIQTINTRDATTPYFIARSNNFW